MPRAVVHKESLPAQVGIKRRRAPAEAEAPDAEERAGAVAEEKVGTGGGDRRGADESSDDDDVAELERERERVERLRGRRAGGEAPTATVGVSAYNHDVLFRGRRSGEQGTVTTTDEAKTKNKKAKWEAVQNNAQKSAAFRHFMKSHFK